jgi:phi13 family phage major tail protein
MPKNYRASTGVDEFYYSALLTDTDFSFTTDDIERVKFLQTIDVEMPQEIVRAFGDNETAELAVSNGNTSVTSAFHKIPHEDKVVLFGLQEVDGITGYGSIDSPPYVACVFAKTHEDGSKEWVGLTKGMFMRNNINGATKEDSTTFQSEEVTAEFMSRYVEGFDGKMTVLTGRDERGSTSNRDAIFMKVFGKAYPTAAPAGA